MKKNSNRLFSTIAAASVASLLAGTVAFSAAPALADDHEETAKDAGEKSCSGEKACSGDKGCSGDKDKEGDKACSGDKGCSGDKH